MTWILAIFGIVAILALVYFVARVPSAGQWGSQGGTP